MCYATKLANQAARARQAESTVEQICQVQAVTKLRNSLHGMSYGVLVKDINTRQEFWVNVYRDEITIRYADMVKVKGNHIVCKLVKR